MYGGNSYILNQYFYVSVRYMRLYSICLPKGEFCLGKHGYPGIIFCVRFEHAGILQKGYLRD